VIRLLLVLPLLGLPVPLVPLVQIRLVVPV
jgi:hypothetical protein